MQINFDMHYMKQVKKAIIPADGLGNRVLLAAKANVANC